MYDNNNKIDKNLIESISRREALKVYDDRVGSFYSKVKIFIYDLAQLLSLSIEEGGLGCIDAVNLAGGGSEVIGFRENMNQITLSGNKYIRQASLLVLKKIQ